MGQIPALALGAILTLVSINAGPSAAGPSESLVTLQIADSSSYLLESPARLTRAVVVGSLWRKPPMPRVVAHILLTNVAAKDCDLGPIALGTDSDFALVFHIAETFNEKQGPEDTAIYRTLFTAADAATNPSYMYVATMRSPERLESLIGNVPYRARTAIQLGRGSGGSVTVMPKGVEGVPPVEVRFFDGLYGVLQHTSAKKGLRVRFNSDSLLIFSRAAGGGALVRFRHRENKFVTSGEVALTICDPQPDDAPKPFGLDR